MPQKSLTVETPKSQEQGQGKAPKVGFVSLGCPKNLVDSEVMMGMLSSAGARITGSADDADIIVVNTCSFINTAKQESVDTILEMAQLKNAGKAKKLIVAGCLVERYRNEIQSQIPEVDAVVGTGELENILKAAGVEPKGSTADTNSPFTILNSSSASQALKSGLHHKHDSDVHEHARPEGLAREQAGRFSRNEWDGAIADLPNYLYDDHTPRVLSTAKYTAYVKIAEGCDHPCAFCIIPQLRGKFRSRHFESVVAEVERLAEQGVREVNLIGQDTTCYGEDLGLKDGLALLLEALAKVEKIKWVRFLYAYPNKITGKLLQTIAANPKICPYIDVPLQHASASVLKRMKRGASAEIFLKSIAKMRKEIPNLTLRTSFIVGFPGETKQDFEELVEFVKAAEFDWLGVFSYSDEEGSPAYKLDGKVGENEIERRRKKLMQVQKSISKRRRKQMMGKTIEVVLEGPSEETDMLWEARTAGHAPDIDGKVFINDFGDREDVKAGEFVMVEVTETHEYDLVARLV